VLEPGQGKIYVDGSLVFTTTFANSNTSVHDGLQIGGLTVNDAVTVYSDSGFIGLIDNVRIFTKALSDAEVQQLYNEGLSRILFAKPDGSVWRYDSGTSTWVQVVTDKSTLTDSDFSNY